MRIPHLALSLIGTMTADACLAAWEVVPQVMLRANADDNPRLDSSFLARTGGAEDSATSMLLDGRLSLSNVTERGELFFEPRFRTDSYADDEDKELESEDLFLVTRGVRRWRATTAGIQSYISRESIFSSELIEAEPIDPDFEDPVPIDTGVLSEPTEHRTRVLVSPYLETRLSERSNFLLGARLQDVSYSGAAVSGRSDFQEALFSAGVARSANERNRISAEVVVSQFEADLTRNETDTVGVEGSFTRILSDAWTFALSTGLQRSEFQLATDPELGLSEEGVETSVTFGMGFRKRTEVARLNIDIQQLVTPNASGYLEERDEFRVYLGRQMTPRLSGGFAFRYMDTSALGDVSDFQREYLRFGVDFEWAVTPQWSLGGGLDTTRQEWPHDDIDGTSNAVWIGMSYRGLSRRNAR